MVVFSAGFLDLEMKMEDIGSALITGGGVPALAPIL